MKTQTHCNKVISFPHQQPRLCQGCGGVIHSGYRAHRYCRDCWHWGRIGLHVASIEQLMRGVQ